MGLKSLLLILGITIPCGVAGIYGISKIEDNALRLAFGTIGAGIAAYGIGMPIAREIRDLKERERIEYELRLRRRYENH